MRIDLRIEGRPCPWKAPLVGKSRDRKRTELYCNPAYDAWKLSVFYQARAQLAGVKPLAAPCRLAATFHLRKRPGAPPDLTNLVKGLEDPLQGVAVENDRLIARHETQRVFVEANAWEGVVLTIEELSSH